MPAERASTAEEWDTKGRLPWREHLTDEERLWIAEDDALVEQGRRLRPLSRKGERAMIVNRAIQRTRYRLGIGVRRRVAELAPGEEG